MTDQPESAAASGSAPVPASTASPAWTPGPWEVCELMGRPSVQARHPMTAGLPHATGYIVLATPAPFGNEYRAEQLATCRLISAAPDLAEFAQRPVVCTFEEDEEYVCLAVNGLVVARHFNSSPEGIALLKFEAERVAALAKANGHD